MVGGSILGLIAWINHYQSFIKEEWTVTDAAGKLCQDGTMLKKPYDPKTLLDRIKRLLAARARREAG